MTEVEYIVIGSGAGGGPLAANLARKGCSVLLIEAGADAGGLSYEVPAFHAHSTDDPSMQWNYFVRHYDRPPRPDPKDRPELGGIWYPRAGTLGGCTAHNALILVYPEDSDWDAIAAATGDASWAGDKMRGYFQRLERCTYHRGLLDRIDDRSGHGYDGWLPTAKADPLIALRDLQIVEMILAAAKSAGVPGLAAAVLDDLLDPNDRRVVGEARRDGLYLTPMTVLDGKRHSVRDYIRQTQQENPGKLQVLTGALVTRVLIEGGRAVGVEYLPDPHAYRADPNAPKTMPPWSDVARTVQAARASREVIVSGGAFNSPQLLMLSGIGPRRDLQRLGIPVVRDLPGVGQNLQDRYEVTVISQFDQELTLLKGCKLAPPAAGDPPDPAFQEWQKDASGIYATNGVVIGFIRRSSPAKPAPDLFIFGLPGAFAGYYPGYSGDIIKRDHFAWAILKGHTNNTAGQVTLRSADPRDTPDINFHYFEEGSDAKGEDLAAVVAGVEFARGINAHLLKSPTEVSPGPTVASKEQIADFVRQVAWGHHASCSNKMGPASDPLAVVGSDFRVHGIDGLRVVDASIFPRIPGLFIVSAVYMIAEKATDAILSDRH
ncbi:MAG TPA: GMC oxidoreductase [Stellaceae bacterium]|nr:GMC oxidoreductase [Stellaceae bacterium]